MGSCPGLALNQNNLAPQNLVTEVNKKAQQLTAFIQGRGYPICHHSPQAHSKLLSLTASHLTQIFQELTFLEKLISEPVTEIQSEKKFSQSVLSRINMKAPEGFWKRLDSDDVIEIYGEDGVQIFRSFNIFRTTGYSLLDLNLYAWDELWERSSCSLTDLQTVVQDILAGDAEEYLSDSPGEAIKEVLNTSFTEPFQPRTLLTRVRQIAACRDISTNKIRGFAVASSSRIIALGKDSENIRFI